MPTTHPSFDELHVVSDIHLGGVDPFQIFDQGPTLASLIDHLAHNGTPRLGLVLNGDIVDFLAEEKAQYLDAEGAVRKLVRIMDDPAFSPVFAALARFVTREGRTLVLVLGNHDVELALPRVRECLRERLCGDSSAARGRLELAMDGAGYACRVGERSVLCLHGNEVDDFNVVDYRALLELSRAQNRGCHPLPTWKPNAGTKLVIDIMNPIKQQHAFVDLLKPETRAVPAVLLALDPQQRNKLASFAGVALRLVLDATRRSTGFLSAEAIDADVPESLSDAEALERLLSGARGRARPCAEVDVNALLDSVEDDVANDRPVLAGVGDDQGTLGVVGLTADTVFRRDPRENLRKSLKDWLREDNTFATDTRDETYTKLDEAVAGNVDFLVAGHTHLMRAIRRPSGGAYFNSGTWTRLLQLSDAMLADEAAFAPFFNAVKQGTMQALDNAPGLVMRRLSVVSIRAQVNGAAGELATASLDGESLQLTPVDGTRLEVVRR